MELAQRNIDGQLDLSELSDGDIVRACQADPLNTEAFAALYERFKMAVFSIAMRRLKNRQDALETTQDVFLQIRRKLHQLEHPERIAGWISTITRNMAINRRVREPQKAVHLADGGQYLPGEGDCFEKPDISIIEKEQRAIMHQLIKELRLIDKEVVHLFYLYDFSLLEIAAALHVPVGTVKRRLHTARQRLRESLSEKFPDYIESDED